MAQRLLDCQPSQLGALLDVFLELNSERVVIFDFFLVFLISSDCLIVVIELRHHIFIRGQEILHQPLFSLGQCCLIITGVELSVEQVYRGLRLRVDSRVEVHVQEERFSHLVDVADGDTGEEDLVQGPSGGLDRGDHLGLVEVPGGDVDKVTGSYDGAANNQQPDLSPGILTGKDVPDKSDKET